MKERGPGSLRRQIVVSTVALTAFAMGLMALMVQLVLAQVVDSNVHRELADRANALIAAVSAEGFGGVDEIEEDGRLGAGGLVFDSTRTLRSGTVPSELRNAVATLEDTTSERSVDVARQPASSPCRSGRTPREWSSLRSH